MEIYKVAFAICLCMIAVLAGFSSWLYIEAKGLESKIDDLESQMSNLETQNAELETKANDIESRLNNSESRVNDLESRVSEQLVIVSYPYSYFSSQTVSFQILHMGTVEVTISEIRVDGVLNSSSPGWVGNRTLSPGQMGEITLYGQKYFDDGFEKGIRQFRFVTARGNSFYCLVLYEGGTITPTPTEQLEIVSLAWNNNVTFTVKNTGTVDLTIVEVRVNDEHTTINPSSVTLDPGGEATITVSKTDGFTSGVNYDFAFITASGNIFHYLAIAP